MKNVSIKNMAAVGQMIETVISDFGTELSWCIQFGTITFKQSVRAAPIAPEFAVPNVTAAQRDCCLTDDALSKGDRIVSVAVYDCM